MDSLLAFVISGHAHPPSKFMIPYSVVAVIEARQLKSTRCHFLIIFVAVLNPPLYTYVVQFQSSQYHPVVEFLI
jgi:hypothetical protein